MIKVLRITVTFFLIKGVICPPMHSIPQYTVNFCKDNSEIESIFGPSLVEGYKVKISKHLPAATDIKVKLDSESIISFDKEERPSYNARFTSEIDNINNIFCFVVLEECDEFVFKVKDNPRPYQPPYVVSIKINGEEQCKDPDRDYFNRHPLSITKLWATAPDKFCGRRRISKRFTPLIVHGSGTRAGYWPWHAAIYSFQKGNLQYICGGTLVSKFLVVTAAHCVTKRGVPLNPDMLGVVLGKYTLIGTEVATQDREVYRVNVYDGFDRKTMNNDIALLKLSAEAIFNNYVQPACIWLDEIYDHLNTFEITGTIVGWGIDQTENLSRNLREATMPQVSDMTCITYEPIFYTKVLNGKKFCAGCNNGSAACNGDSGGGFLVFVEDEVPLNYLQPERSGAWYLKGIISVSLARNDADICDPKAYTVFTDVAKYRNWILDNMN